MRLAVTAEYLLKAEPIKALAFILFLTFVTCGMVPAQQYRLTFDKETPLSEALLQVSRTYHIRVAYNAMLMQSVNIREPAEGETIDELMKDLLKNSGFSFLYRHGCYLMIRDNAGDSTKYSRFFQLTGSVMDAQTGESLPFATVQIDEQQINVMATSNGTFSIKNIVANPVRLRVSFIGYQTVDTLLEWRGEYAGLQIRMKQNVTSLKPIDVVRNRPEMIEFRNNVDFATTINTFRLADMPMLVETDVFRTLQLLPGISYSEGSSELNIRGGSSDQNLVLFDGQTLYNLSHYYGVFSALNPGIIKDIQVFKGGFDSRYGERISGIVDITGKSGNQTRPLLNLNINLLSVNLSAEVPLSPRLTLLAAVRRSYADIYSTSFADNLFEKQQPAIQSKPDDTVTISTPAFYFYDINARLNYRISDKENLSLSLYHGRDHYLNAYELNSRSLHIANADSNNWHNYGISLNWQKQWNASFFTSLTAGTSGYENSANSGTKIEKLLNETEEQPFLPDSQNVFATASRNKLHDLSVTLRNSYTINSHNQLDFGALVRRNYIYYHKDADKVYIYDNTTQISWIGAFYAQDRITLFSNLDVKPGIRVSYYSGKKGLYFEPRLAVRYSLSDQLAIRMAAGRYNQFISQVLSPQETNYTRGFWMLSNDSLNPVLRANHYITGISWSGNGFFIDVEGYYKSYTGQQEYFYVSQFLRDAAFEDYFPHEDNPPPPPGELYSGEPSYFITGSGKSYGIDFFAGLRIGICNSWLSYSLGKSVQQYNQINNGEEIPALTDQRHQVSISGMLSPGNWNLGTIWLFTTGRPYITFSREETDQSVTREYKRLPNYFRWDISANYRFKIKNVRIKAGISVINLLNNHNYLDINSRTYNFAETTFSETNLVQSQKRSLNLFLNISL